MKPNTLQMKKPRRILSCAVLIAMGLAQQGCNEIDPTITVEPIKRLKQSTVYIQNTGHYEEYPQAGGVVYGRGSGFIVSTDGYVVTNAHVANGTGTIKVFLRDENGDIILDGDGATPKGHIASVKGISECADLAVIKIDEGVAATPLSFYQGEIAEGLVVIAAGYPSIEGMSFNSTTGTISNRPKSTPTPWAYPISFAHEARINNGNSGGPLVVAATGEVVGVNFAGSSEYDTNRAISGLAGKNYNLQTLVEKLKEGDIFSIGINGEAIVSGDTPMGVWVSAVRPGSPAARANIKAGDTIISLNNHPLTTRDPGNYTLRNYCEVLAGNDPGKGSVVPFTVETSDGRQLSGELNGAPLNRGITAAPTDSRDDGSVIVIRGALTSDDFQADDGRYLDGYIIDAGTNGTVTVEMLSQSMDSFLIVLRMQPDGESVDRDFALADDDSGSGNNARIVFDKEAGRRYIIVATSRYPMETGSYELRFGDVDESELEGNNQTRAASSDLLTDSVLENIFLEFAN